MTETWLVWVLCALFGASVTRLLHADSLTAPLRERWEAHWQRKVDAVLVEANSHMQIPPTSDGELDVGRVRASIFRRSTGEPGVGMFVFGARREHGRPWTVRRERLERAESWLEFPSCPWCTSFWVYAVAAVWTWGRVYGFGGEVFAPVVIPADYALIALAFGFRWLYATVVTALGQAR